MTSLTYLLACLSVDTANLVVHEFAFLCLSSLAVDFTAKITVAEKGGLRLLMNGILSTDPDIQKNCVETLALMLQVAQLASVIFCILQRFILFYYDKFLKC